MAESEEVTKINIKNKNVFRCKKHKNKNRSCKLGHGENSRNLHRKLYITEAGITSKMDKVIVKKGKKQGCSLFSTLRLTVSKPKKKPWEKLPARGL